MDYWLLDYGLLAPGLWTTGSWDYGLLAPGIMDYPTPGIMDYPTPGLWTIRLLDYGLFGSRIRHNWL